MIERLRRDASARTVEDVNEDMEEGGEERVGRQLSEDSGIGSNEVMPRSGKRLGFQVWAMVLTISIS